MALTKKNYVDLTGLSTFKSSLLGTVINDSNKATTSKTATIKAIADYVDSEVEDLSSAVTAELAKKVSSVTYDSTNKKLVYNKGGSTNTDIVTVATLKSAIGNFGKSGTGASAGLVPAPSTTAGTSKYLREDGTWVTPPNTTYSVFGKSGSTASTGLVPKPSTTAGTSKYLREDGSWVTPPDTNTTYTNATTSKAGLMGADDKAKLDGIATNANNYSHPTYTSKTSGLYKITVDGTGHVSGATAVAKADITALGIPGSDTTYSVFGKSGSGAKSGLVPAPSTTAGTSKYLREDGTWTTPPDTNTTYSNATSSSAGLMGADDKAKLDGITASADSVSFSRSLTSGTKVGTITINGTATDLYAPTNTDTHYTAKNVVSSSNTGTANVTAATDNPYVNLIENGTVRSTHRISGSGATTVKTDTSGNIIISSTDTNTTYTNATASQAGLMGADDKAKLDGITESADSVSFTRSLTSGTKVGTITINGTGTDLYAPTNTDTHYTAVLVLGGAPISTGNASQATANPYLNIVENGAKSSGIGIKGSGATSVSAENGILTIKSTDTTYSNVRASKGGTEVSLVTTGDKYTWNNKANAFTVTNGGNTASWGNSVTVGTVAGTSLTFTMPANPNTDTHYTAKNVVASSSTGTANVTAATDNPYVNLIENGTVRSTHRISGSGATTVKTDTSGNIIISSTDTNTTNVSATTTGSGNAVTAITASGSAISVTKGATFLTSHQDISGKENISNKVKSWSATTTDDHYPSEKLVKSALDEINTVVGDINSILDRINGEVV